MKELESKIILYKNEPHKVLKAFPGGFYMVEKVYDTLYIELVLHKDITPYQILENDFME